MKGGSFMPMVVNNEVYLDTEEAYKHLGVSRQTLNKYVRQRKLTQYKPGVGQTVYYKQSELDLFKAMHPVEPDEK
jgi:excisionase family DNA binding protein